MSEGISHPFPYFKIPVTRDGEVIRLAVEAMYKKKQPFENHPTRNGEYREFTALSLLIARKPAGTSQPGVYEADPPKVEAIVERCLKELGENFLGQVSEYDNSVHPRQIPKCIEMAKKAPFDLDENEARRYLDQLIQSKGIVVTVVKPQDPPKRTPQPVAQVKGECGDRVVRLSWVVPATDCDGVKIARSERENPKLGDSVGESKSSQWDDTNLVPGKRYHYCVFSMLGTESLGSKQVEVETRGVVADFTATLAGTKAVLTWKLPENAKELFVFRGPAAIPALVDERARLKLPPKVEQIAALGPTATTFEDTKAAPGSTWHYAVAVRHEVGSYSPSESRSVTFPVGPRRITGLDAKLVGAGHVYLSWQPIANCSYRIQREVVGSKDGPKSLTKTRRTVHDDSTVEPGTTYRYSVSAINDDNEIEGDPLVSDPVMATGEVTELVPLADEGQVTLTWKPPRRAKRVEVRRQAKSPPLPADGPGSTSPGVDLFIPTESGRFLDPGLANGTTYGYRVSCVFLAPDGKEIVTRGETVTATPRRPPTPIVSPRIEAIGPAVRISWTNPNKETVVVVRAASRPDLRPTQQIPLTRLDEFGQRLSHCGRSETIDSAPDPSLQGNYLIFTVDSEVAVFGGAVRMLEVGDARIQQEEGSVLVRWTWPEDCRGVRITRAGGDKQIDVPWVSTKSDTGKLAFPVAKLGSGTHVFHLKCLADAGDPTTIAGPGITLRTRIVQKERISWSLERKKIGSWPRRQEQVEVVIVGEHQFDQIERFVLVGQVGHCPDSVETGSFVHEWEPDPDDDGAIRLIPPGWWKSDYGRVFCRLFAEPAEAAAITHPPAEQCCL